MNDIQAWALVVCCNEIDVEDIDCITEQIEGSEIENPNYWEEFFKCKKQSTTQ